MAKRKAAKKKTKRKARKKTARKKAPRKRALRKSGKIKAWLWHRHGGHTVGFGPTYIEARDQAAIAFMAKYGPIETPVGESFNPPLPPVTFDKLPAR